MAPFSPYEHVPLHGNGRGGRDHGLHDHGHDCRGQGDQLPLHFVSRYY